MTFQSGKYSSMSSGCFKGDGSNMYFNTVSTFVASENMQPVCKESIQTGVYKAVGKDETGRFVYQLPGKKDLLRINNATGQWCLGDLCTSGSEARGAVAPLGLALQGVEYELDVVEITDFKGQFLGGGTTPGLTAKQKKAPMVTKLPKLPKQPRVAKPQLANYDFKKPQYASYCKTGIKVGKDADIKDLWGGMEVLEDAPAPYTPSFGNEKLLDNHPCKLAPSAEGSEMNYQAISDCSTREIDRGWDSAQQQLISTLVQAVVGRVGKSSTAFSADGSWISKLICSFFPEVNTAPSGLGATTEPSAICKALAYVGETVVFGGLEKMDEQFSYNREEVGNADCDPLQTSMQRLYCDLHCVRDATVRGDATINHNIKEAATVIKKNMDALATWQTKSTTTQGSWEVDVMKLLTSHLAGLVKQIYDTLPYASSSMTEIKSSTDQMLQEINALSQQASADITSRTTAERALSEFVTTSERLDADAPNATDGAMALRRMQQLHGVLQAAGKSSIEDQTRAIIRQNVKDMQRAVRASIGTLGVYKVHNDVTQKYVRRLSSARTAEEQASSESLIALDKIWWKLRAKVDSYLDIEQAYLDQSKENVENVNDYQLCSGGFSSLMPAYQRAMETREIAHASLKTTWRDSIDLMGELAAVIEDGDMFEIFVHQQGCSSTLAQQTKDQSDLALRGLTMIIGRFKAAGLPKPDTTIIKEAATRIEDSFKSARRSCE